LKKEEFMQYIEGIADVLEAAGLEKLEAVMDEIMDKAGTIEINVTYPYYNYYPYWYQHQQPYITWNSRTSGGGTLNTTTVASTNTCNWRVVNLANGDFEIVKD